MGDWWDAVDPLDASMFDVTQPGDDRLPQGLRSPTFQVPGAVAAPRDVGYMEPQGAFGRPSYMQATVPASRPSYVVSPVRRSTQFENYAVGPQMHRPTMFEPPRQASNVASLSTLDASVAVEAPGPANPTLHAGPLGGVSAVASSTSLLEQTSAARARASQSLPGYDAAASPAAQTVQQVQSSAVPPLAAARASRPSFSGAESQAPFQSVRPVQPAAVPTPRAPRSSLSSAPAVPAGSPFETVQQARARQRLSQQSLDGQMI
jgi:hypothetical protein